MGSRSKTGDARGHSDASLEIDTRAVPLDAPNRTPSPLREAFEAVAHAVFVAAEMHRSPSSSGPLFETEAHNLARELRAARSAYAQAELRLQAVSPATGKCAHQEALNAVNQINDRVGHVMLGIVPLEEAVAYLKKPCGFRPIPLLRAMRRQVSRAALQALSVRGKLEETKSQIAPSRPAAAKPSRMKQPCDDAITAYRLQIGTGLKQGKLAQKLIELWRRPVDQGTVSRWLSQVRKFIEAGNVLPGVEDKLRRQKPTVMDPRRIDLGKRQDQRIGRRRPIRRPEDD